MAASTDRLPDTAQAPSPTRTPSSSPLPTPTSSQVRIHDVRVRTRKISQTAHDNVDMLDHTDPWGTNWHHQSPYDVGKNSNSSEPPESPTASTRPRRASMTNGARHRATVPSPLSQSTSAVHLASEPLHMHAPRRLSKRRKTFRGLFGNSDHEHRPFMSRGGPSTVAHANGQELGRKLSHTGSIVQPSSTSSAGSIALTEQSSKRSSMLGRLVKRFSVIRRSDASKSTKSSFHSVTRSSEYESAHAGAESPVPRRSESPEKAPQQQMKPRDTTRRVPPPADTPETQPHSSEEPRARDSDDQSLLSVEQRYSMGKLTVANPDNSNTSNESPVRGEPSPVQPYHDVNFPLRTSPEPMEYPPPHPPFHAHPVRAPLSVISEGETYMSSPRMQPSSPKESPATPPTIPSLLSLPARSAAMPMDHPTPPLSPPLPDLPYNPSLPEIPNFASAVSVAAQPLLPRLEPSLPPTPVPSHPPTPSSRETQPEPTCETVSESRAETRTDPKGDRSYREESSKARSFVVPSAPSIYQPMASYADNSPLARASMIVNPPTPYTTSVAIPTPTPPPIISIALPKTEPKASTADSLSTPKDGSRKMRSKHTETFKLMRTASGHVQTVDNSFVADGEHWHVVESPKEERRKSRRDRERSEEPEKPEKPERRKSKRAEKESASDESDPQRAQTHARHASVGRGYPDAAELSSSRASKTRESPHRDSSHRQRPSTHEKRRSSREAQVDAGVRSTQTPVIYTPRPHGYSTIISTVSGAKLEPRTSVSASTRPSSEFQSVADINALKAKDAWEIERLWKGRSMIHAPDGSTANGNRHHISSDSRPSTIMSHDLHRASTIPSVGGETAVSTYGSDHTIYRMHSPYQGTQHAATYPQLSGSPPSERPTNGVVQHAARYVQSVELPTLPPIGSSPPRTNPLPEPPRLSSYQPSPLPPSLAGSGDGPGSPEYWNRYAGVTVTH
ncbi:hypothetical protein PHLGIDRAFT_124072 [Phlebiopsis gigantea 11061_1 CR5-6]|uniref:Uncharacterized protein n=1 Tax=Phlebiopsis gigantea (strain 11061_1 CR5-6) TaxID=745531 RepID=A0A0C3SE93_PHLG1|nr:hypothetical protein PHLGIDRAFT_124072 [Phlebiopsis gigantea 11061_1 CR5-6]